MGSSLISSHGRKWRGGGPKGGDREWQAGREGPSALPPIVHYCAHSGRGWPPSPLPPSLQFQVGELRGQLISQGLLTIFITAPH